MNYGTDTTTDINVPLNREELASYYTASMMANQDTIKVVLNSFFQTVKEALDRQEESYKALISDMRISHREEMDALKETLATFKNGINVITTTTKQEETKTSPVFSTIQSNYETNLKVKQYKGAIAKLANDFKISEPTIYKMIYGLMKKDGYDINSLFAEYKGFHPNTTKIDMIAGSDVLRLSFEKQTNNFTYNKKYLTKNKINKYVSKLSPSGCATGRVYKKAYKLVKQYYNVDVYEAAKKYKKSRDLKYVPISEIVSADRKMINMVKDSVDRYLGGDHA